MIGFTAYGLWFGLMLLASYCSKPELPIIGNFGSELFEEVGVDLDDEVDLKKVAGHCRFTEGPACDAEGRL